MGKKNIIAKKRNKKNAATIFCHYVLCVEIICCVMHRITVTVAQMRSKRMKNRMSIKLELVEVKEESQRDGGERDGEQKEQNAMMAGGKTI